LPYHEDIVNNYRVDDIPPMTLKRHYAASVLDENGDMWVLGGFDGPQSAGTTEIFQFSSRRWRRGRPLPSELRDSGISSQCAVRINKTHVLMAGGYRGDFEFVNPNFPDQKSFIAGKALNQVIRISNHQ